MAQMKEQIKTSEKVKQTGDQQSIRCRVQNTVTRDIEIKNKLIIMRGEVEGDNSGGRGKGCQGTCIKDIWTKPKEGRIKGGR